MSRWSQWLRSIAAGVGSLMDFTGHASAAAFKDAAAAQARRERSAGPAVRAKTYVADGGDTRWVVAHIRREDGNHQLVRVRVARTKTYGDRLRSDWEAIGSDLRRAAPRAQRKDRESSR